MNELDNTSLQFLQLFLLLLGYAEADQFVKTRFHKVVHARH